jgi:hypothetical protein
MLFLHTGFLHKIKSWADNSYEEDEVPSFETLSGEVGSIVEPMTSLAQAILLPHESSKVRVWFEWATYYARCNEVMQKGASAHPQAATACVQYRWLLTSFQQQIHQLTDVFPNKTISHTAASTSLGMVNNKPKTPEVKKRNIFSYDVDTFLHSIIKLSLDSYDFKSDKHQVALFYVTHLTEESFFFNTRKIK